MEKEKDITAAVIELSAEQRVSIRRGFIDAACESNPRAREIQAELVKCGAEQNDCQRIAQIYHLSTRGANDAFKAQLKALIAPGVTAESFNAKLNELELAADAASPTQAAIVGHEGVEAASEKRGWKLFERIEAKNKKAGYAPPEYDQAVIGALRGAAGL